MKQKYQKLAKAATSGLLSGMALCLFAAPVFAQQATEKDSDLPETETILQQPFNPMSLVQNNAILSFDMNSSDTRQLQLQLAEPLTLSAGTESHWLSSGGNSILADTSLEWSVTDQLEINTGFRQSSTQIDFQSVGSIRCENGVLEAGSYRASDCHFIDDTNDLNMGVISIGAEYEVGNNALAAINMFRQESSFNSSRIQAGAIGSAVLDPSLSGAMLANPLLPGFSSGTGLESLETSVSGIDLSFNVGVSTDNAGDMQLGLQFTHMLEGNYEGFSMARNGFTSWAIAEPFDTAKVSFDWQKNSFSGGVQGFYRDQVDFLNRENLDSLATFDVYFTWRAPWNANVTVGASNVLNAGMEDASKGENTIIDPFEAVYGRIPYVRYKQDL